MSPQKIFWYVIYAGGVIVIFAYAIWRPTYNWDLIGYVAAVRSQQGATIAEAHAEAYGLVREAAPAWAYEDLTTSMAYRRDLAQDPSALEQILPFYSMRLAYCGAIRLGEGLGLPIIQAAYVANAGGVAAGLLLLPIFFRGSGAPAYLGFLFPAALVFGALVTAQQAVPDGLAFCAVVVLFWLLERYPRAGLLLAPLLIACRQDLVILAMLVQVHALLFRAGLRGFAVAGIACTLALHAANSHYFGFYSYMDVLLFSFDERTAYPADTEFHFTWMKYARIFASGLAGFFDFRAPMAFALVLFGVAVHSYLTAGSLVQAIWSACRNVEAQLFVLTPVTYFAARFVLFPLVEDRYLLSVYILPLVYLVRRVQERVDAVAADA